MEKTTSTSEIILISIAADLTANSFTAASQRGTLGPADTDVKHVRLPCAFHGRLNPGRGDGARASACSGGDVGIRRC